MGLFDELGKALAPHAHRLNETIHLQGALVHGRLQKIEEVLSTRATILDTWFRLRVQREFTAEEPVELAVVPMNEVWVFQALVSDGLFAKAPAYVITVANALIASVIKEGVGTEKMGGDMVALPGEKIVLTARTTGTVSICLHIIRRQLPSQKALKHGGISADVNEAHNTHDPARDLILSRTGGYDETQRETRDFTGSPPLAK